jgi:ankyrin repeat protein
MTSVSDASSDALLEANIPSWDDGAVPLEARGISRHWLADYVRSVLNDVSKPRRQAIQEAQRAEIRNRSRLLGLHDAPDLPVPAVPPLTFLTTHGLVNRVIKPRTASVRAPLYAMVPEEFRGSPTTFISHTWSSLLVGPQRQPLGTLDALEQCDHEFVWIDFVCYNQHTFIAIPDDMLRVIRTIGSVSVCATPTPIYTRGWCLWELLCAARADTAVSLLVRRGFRNDKIMAVNALYRSFQGIEKANSSVPEDLEMIRSECLSHFGSVERADAEFERIIRDRFSDSVYELQDKNEQMKFSPTPWIAGDSGAQPAAFEPYFEPGLLDSAVFDSDHTVRELFFDAGVYLGTADARRVITARAKATWQQSDTEVQKFFRCILSGDAAGVKKHLELGCDPKAELNRLTPIVIAAGRGDAAIVEMLIAAGAETDPVDVVLSPLRLAADKGHDDVVQTLLRLGSAVDAVDGETGWTALMWASASGHDDIAKTLLASGADVNHAGSGKRPTALHLGAQNGRIDVVRTLLAHGANVDAREYRGLTALHLAAYMGHADIVGILLRQGADPSAQGSQGETVRGLAEDRHQQHVIEVLTSGK